MNKPTKIKYCDLCDSSGRIKVILLNYEIVQTDCFVCGGTKKIIPKKEGFNG